MPKPGFDLRLITPCHWLLWTFTGAVFTHAEIFPLCGLLNFNASIRFFTNISVPPKISSKLVYIKRYHFRFCLKAQKSMYHKWQFNFDKNMAVGKSENLAMLHPHDLTQPFLRGSSDFGTIDAKGSK